MSGSTLPPMPSSVRARLDSQPAFDDHYHHRTLLMLWSVTLFVLGASIAFVGRHQGDTMAQILGLAAVGIVVMSAAASRFWLDMPMSLPRRLLTEAPFGVGAVVLLLCLGLAAWGLIGGLVAALYLTGFAALFILAGLMAAAWMTRSLWSPSGIGLRGPVFFTLESWRHPHPTVRTSGVDSSETPSDSGGDR